MTMTTRQKERSDQTSHKVIEKRRRDRINNCLAELSQTVPAAFAKQLITCNTIHYKSDWFTSDVWADFMHHYQVGYNECMQEVVRYMTDVEGIDTNDSRCIRIMSYLQTRFRPDASINTGNVYRDTISRVASQVTRMQYGAGSNLTCTTGTSIRSLHRYNPYVAQGSHGTSYLNVPSPTAVVNPVTSCPSRINNNSTNCTNATFFGRNSHMNPTAFPLQNTHAHKPLLTTALSNSTNLPSFLFTTNNNEVIPTITDPGKLPTATVAISERQPQMLTKHSMRSPAAITSKM
ncbi:transcription factor HES-4 [Octopus bimaculoides]|nr:transcription factor HES-4 [Octopus bimaculoides]